MELRIKKENLSVRLKNILRERNVKLWLSPYLDESNRNTDNLSITASLRELARNYCQILNIEHQQCLEMLLELQKKSLAALKEKSQFLTEGVATIKVKVSGSQPSEFSTHMQLSDLVENMKQKIASKMEISSERLKLISGGRILRPEHTLEAEKIKHNSMILVVILQDNSFGDVLLETKNNNQLLEETRQDIETLTKYKRNNRFLSITNQNGLNLDIPDYENKILLTAMTLHEKGRDAFRKRNYSLALLFFHEADEEFKRCRSEILQSVDNYGLLNLDIVWTYLHLQSVHQLSDAESRLKICEQTLMRSYGSNLERLKSIKGTSGNERVLFMRLHLLQGILCHLKNRKDQSLTLFKNVEKDIEDLKIDRENVMSLRKLGYSVEEATFALRATYNDINAAANYILRQREEKIAVKEYERKRGFADQHLCKDGSQINLTVLEQMHEMGYTRLFSVHALVHSNNEINDALLWMDKFITDLNNQYPSYVTDVLLTLEFDSPNVPRILKKYNHQLTDLCIRELIYNTPAGREYIEKIRIENPRFIVPNMGQTLASVSQNHVYLPDASLPGTSSANLEHLQSMAYEEGIVNEEEKVEEAFARLQAGISASEYDYLDSNLESEEKYLKLYKSFSV